MLFYDGGKAGIVPGLFLQRALLHIGSFSLPAVHQSECFQLTNCFSGSYTADGELTAEFTFRWKLSSGLKNLIADLRRKIIGNLSVIGIG